MIRFKTSDRINTFSLYSFLIDLLHKLDLQIKIYNPMNFCKNFFKLEDKYYYFILDVSEGRFDYSDLKG